ncbi:ABC transporter permease subunit [Alkalibacter rhizosphaerae]|uniref:ABC transporter permease subunit n=1 Tax=Alkalibacter rhizosphaerae TaxID=2815577 RepID=A0A975AJ75_9FIRM|nr:ABC transporter permease subunit [Alkalibacter rhizosphaerae]QSX09444.1 ABC transporter permease subunit [Alkalibacter rhizosphaerae]
METRGKAKEGIHGFGLLLMAVGILNPSFLILRPNRIVSGVSLNVFAAGEDPFFFLTALFFIMGFFIVASVSNKHPWPELMGMILVSWIFLLFIGRTSFSLLADQPTSARISLGMGFWLVLGGILILLRQKTSLLQERYHHSRLGIWIPSLVFAIFFIGLSFFFILGWLDSISIMGELANQGSRIWTEFIRHMQLTLHAVLTGILLSFLLGYGAYKKEWIERPVNLVANFFQVIPTLSLLGLLMVPLSMLAVAFPILKALGINGIGYFPAYVVLTTYTLLPLTNHILAGFRSISPLILEGARGMGMTSPQILYRIELPLALPAIYTGIRTALVQTVANTILAGLVGGGGLGALLFLGLAQSALDLVVVASLLVVLVSVSLNLVMAGLEETAKSWQHKEDYND